MKKIFIIIILFASAAFITGCIGKVEQEISTTVQEESEGVVIDEAEIEAGEIKDLCLENKNLDEVPDIPLTGYLNDELFVPQSTSAYFYNGNVNLYFYNSVQDKCTGAFDGASANTEIRLEASFINSYEIDRVYEYNPKLGEWKFSYTDNESIHLEEDDASGYIRIDSASKEENGKVTGKMLLCFGGDNKNFVGGKFEVNSCIE